MGTEGGGVLGNSNQIPLGTEGGGGYWGSQIRSQWVLRGGGKVLGISNQIPVGTRHIKSDHNWNWASQN